MVIPHRQLGNSHQVYRKFQLFITIRLQTVNLTKRIPVSAFVWLLIVYSKNRQVGPSQLGWGGVWLRRVKDRLGYVGLGVVRGEVGMGRGNRGREAVELRR